MFCLYASCVFFVCLCLYPLVLPSYERTVFESTNVVLSGLSPPTRIGTVEDGRWVVTVDAGGRPWSFTLGTARLRLLVFLNMVILPPLLLATPTSLRRRIVLALWGLVLLFLLHIASLTGCVFAMAHVCQGGANRLCRILPSILTPGGQGFAVALWGALTWRDWFPKLSDNVPE